MQLYQEGIYWYFKSPCGPLPNALKGAWTSKARAETALMMFQAKIRANAFNSTERTRQKKERRTLTLNATSNATIPA